MRKGNHTCKERAVGVGHVWINPRLLRIADVASLIRDTAVVDTPAHHFKVESPGQWLLLHDILTGYRCSPADAALGTCQPAAALVCFSLFRYNSHRNIERRLFRFYLLGSLCMSLDTGKGQIKLLVAKTRC